MPWVCQSLFLVHLPIFLLHRIFWGGTHNTTTLAKITAPSNIIAWICRECTYKNEGSKPGPYLMCQAPLTKRKAVVAASAPVAAPVVASAVPAKPERTSRVLS
jgi:hypothetical protein